MLDAPSLAHAVPAVPPWSVRDVLVRHVGFVADLLANDWTALELGTDSWYDSTGAARRREREAEHVSARAAVPLDELIAEWTSHAAPLERILSGTEGWGSTPPMFAEMSTIVDLAVAVQDVRGALSTPGDRDSRATRLGLVFHVGWFGLRVVDTAVPAIRVRAGESEWALGPGEVGASVAGGEFEIFRTFSGRRTEPEVRALEWDGDPAPYLPIVSAYGLPADPVGE